MGFVKECVEDSLPIWEKCLNTSYWPLVRYYISTEYDKACVK